MSGEWLGDLKPQKFQVIFVTDSKPYWRSEYLLRDSVFSQVPRRKKADEKKRQKFLEYLATPPQDLSSLKECDDLASHLGIHYKAGRKFPEYSFTKLKEILLGNPDIKDPAKRIGLIRDRGWTIFGLPGYEADDLAAAFVMVNRTLENPNRIILLTIDSDWMGLVDPHTAWFCQHGWYPRIRSDYASINLWAEKRLGEKLSTPSRIWDIKGRQGDKSDNIPPSDGVLLPVIDLLNPPEEHKLWKQPIAETIKDALEYPKFRQMNPLMVRDAIAYIQKAGVNFCVRPLDNFKDLAA